MHSIFHESIYTVCLLFDYKKNSCSCNRPRQDDNDDAVVSFEYFIFFFFLFNQADYLKEKQNLNVVHPYFKYTKKKKIGFIVHHLHTLMMRVGLAFQIVAFH